MLVFGDRVETLQPAETLAALERALASISAMPVGRPRHDALTAALVRAGMLAQGLADAEFAALGADEDSPVQSAALALVLGLARRLDRSWRSGYAAEPTRSDASLAALAALSLPAAVEAKVPEGFSVYAVYPEAYGAAARQATWRRPLVIGLRSIGLTLGAAAAAALPEADLVTLRPMGDPFRRVASVTPALETRLRRHAGDVLIVDEGPGLSGSSFGAAADLMQRLGAAPAQISFLPSHAGALGGRADPRHAARWTGARRLPATLDRLLAARPIAGWFEDLTGPVEACEDLSGGAWRRDLPLVDRPPAWLMQERRKFRLSCASGVYLARFAGLGDIGAAKYERATALHRAGFAPEPLALRSGFLLERWIDGAPAAPSLDHLARYLGFRTSLPARADQGASFTALKTMAAVNAGKLGGETLGGETLGGEALGRAVSERLAAVAPAGPLVQVDGRLHAWEWRADRAGRLWKTDAIDHCCGHDLVGCQPIAWDIAGAAVEFDLDRGSVDRLRHAVAPHLAPETLDAFVICYCAFQAGLWTYAGEDPAEPRAQERVSLYARRLRQAVLSPELAA